MERNCPTCGVSFDAPVSPKPQIFCGKACAQLARTQKWRDANKQRGIPKLLTCRECSGQFQSTAHNALYCSVKCRQNHNLKRLHAFRMGEQREKVCHQCGGKFLTTSNKSKWCSTKCRKRHELHGWREEDERNGVTRRSWNRRRLSPVPLLSGCNSLPNIGAAGELLVSADLLGRGHIVYRAVGPNGPADLVALIHGKLVAVEVKIARVTADGSIAYRPTPPHAGILARVTPEEWIVTYEPPLHTFDPCGTTASTNSSQPSTETISCPGEAKEETGSEAIAHKDRGAIGASLSTPAPGRGPSVGHEATGDAEHYSHSVG
jgi:hypothetical protein